MPRQRRRGKTLDVECEVKSGSRARWAFRENGRVEEQPSGRGRVEAAGRQDGELERSAARTSA